MVVLNEIPLEKIEVRGMVVSYWPIFCRICFCWDLSFLLTILLESVVDNSSYN